MPPAAVSEEKKAGTESPPGSLATASRQGDYCLTAPPSDFALLEEGFNVRHR